MGDSLSSHIRRDTRIKGEKRIQFLNQLVANAANAIPSKAACPKYSSLSQAVSSGHHGALRYLRSHYTVWSETLTQAKMNTGLCTSSTSNSLQLHPVEHWHCQLPGYRTRKSVAVLVEREKGATDDPP